MANNRISGAGLGLQYPQTLYPANPGNVPYTPPTNHLALAPGETMLIPAGDWVVYIGKYCTIQIMDPILQVWTGFGTTQLKSQSIRSDGVNWRLANLTGCPIGASITAGGSGYTSAPTVGASSGGSLWRAVVGGAINQTVAVPAAGGGSGYTLAPMVFVPAPPPGGVACTMHAVITAGVVTSYVVDNQGAGYLTAPIPSVQAVLSDPNYANIVPAVAPTLTLTGAGQVTAVLCTNNGAPVANVAATPTLAFAGGGGTAAAATVNMEWMIASVTVTTAGTGYPNSGIVVAAGGFAATGTVYANPIIEAGIIAPTREAWGVYAASGGVVGSATMNVDGGLFAGTPVVGIIGGAPTATAVLTPVMGSAYSEAYLQSL